MSRTTWTVQAALHTTRHHQLSMAVAAYAAHLTAGHHPTITTDHTSWWVLGRDAASPQGWAVTPTRHVAGLFDPSAQLIPPLWTAHAIELLGELLAPTTPTTDREGTTT